MIYLYKAWFFTGYARLAMKVSGRSVDEAENIAHQVAAENQWHFTGDMDLMNSIDLEALCRK